MKQVPIFLFFLLFLLTACSDGVQTEAEVENPYLELGGINTTKQNYVSGIIPPEFRARHQETGQREFDVILASLRKMKVYNDDVQGLSQHDKVDAAIDFMVTHNGIDDFKLRQHLSSYWLGKIYERPFHSRSMDQISALTRILIDSGGMATPEVLASLKLLRGEWSDTDIRAAAERSIQHSRHWMSRMDLYEKEQGFAGSAKSQVVADTEASHKAGYAATQSFIASMQEFQSSL